MLSNSTIQFTNEHPLIVVGMVIVVSIVLAIMSKIPITTDEILKANRDARNMEILKQMGIKVEDLIKQSEEIKTKHPPINARLYDN